MAIFMLLANNADQSVWKFFKCVAMSARHAVEILHARHPEMVHAKVWLESSNHRWN